jgi:lipoate-protein ligase A
VQELDLAVEMKEGKAANGPNLNPVCFEVPSTYEITVNGKKLIGSAQARKKEGVLQHGSLPLTGDLTRICRVLVFEDESARDEASKRLLARASTVESALGQEVSWETAAEAFIHAFESHLGLSLQQGELSESESRRTDELVKEKYDHPSWTERV